MGNIPSHIQYISFNLTGPGFNKVRTSIHINISIKYNIVGICAARGWSWLNNGSSVDVSCAGLYEHGALGALLHTAT